MTLPVLLVGAAAEALAPRLRLSGYRPLRLGPEGVVAVAALPEEETGGLQSPAVAAATPPGPGEAASEPSIEPLAQSAVAPFAAASGRGIRETSGPGGGGAPASLAAAAQLAAAGTPETTPTPEATPTPDGTATPDPLATPPPTTTPEATATALATPPVTATPEPLATPLTAVILAPGEEPRIAALRQQWGAVPFLLGIPEDSVEGRSRTLLCGADDFWLTSLAPSDLLTRLRLHRQIPQPVVVLPERLQVADLELIPSMRQVQRGSRRLTLTAREYQLLLLLMEHRGQVLSRERILARVWPDQQGAGSNVIEVYVRYLRQKLEQGGERRLIHTVRGRGYCLNEGPPPLG